MTKVFIYGGCTSRDAVEIYPEHGLELHSYIARQSLISAYHPAHTGHWNFNTVKSPFQQRTFRGDVKSSLPGHLETKADEIDLIIWDHMIERVGVRPVTTGGYVTNNPTTRQKIKDRTLLGERIWFGNDDHLELWSAALDEFVTTLKSVGLHDKIVVNGTPWATHDKHGNPADYPSAGMDAEFFNTTIRKYWDLIEAHGIPIAHVAQDRALSDPDHKWGAAYFHYTPDTYQAQLEAITALTK